MQIFLFIGGAILLAAFGYLARLFLRGDIRRLVSVLRFTLGWGAMALAGLFLVTGRVGPGSLLGLAGASILSRGRLGPIDFGAGMPRPANSSVVSSRYFLMELDHDSGAVTGTVREGPLARADLIDLDADQCWTLYLTVAHDPDSLALFETWLDANRDGWRDYFASQYGFEGTDRPGHEDAWGKASPDSSDAVAEAYAVLGLAPGANAEAVRAAHRALMKKMHPDHGGSAHLAARINEAKDVLLAALDGRS